jgi:ribosomal protein S18 acetylase RimI-like enzyme
MLTVRPGAPAETGIVSELVLQSDCGMLAALFGENAGGLLRHLLAAPSNPYGPENTLVIVNESLFTKVIGAAVGSTAGATRRANLRTAGLLFGWYGPALLARLPRLARAGKSMDSLAPNDFYLSHIAVLPGQRGRGAGRELLLAVEARARTQGARRLLLDVEEHNDGARRFYDRLGYGPESAVRIDLGRRGAYSFVRMLKGL